MADASNRHAYTITDTYSRRLELGYRVGSLTVFALGLIWFSIFIARGWWDLAAAELVLSAIAFISWVLIRAGRQSTAIIVSEFAFLAFAIGFCLIFDVPDDTVPRVSHLFLLVLAMLGYINYLRSRSSFQLVVIVACLCSFIAFSSANLSFHFARPIPNELRLVGTWINSATATALLCGCIYVIRLEFSRQSAMLRALRSAIRNNELELFLQPQVDRSGAIVGAEALLRWNRPGQDYVSPEEFIQVAERGNLMPLIGGWVLKEACRILAEWKHDPALAKLTLAINVSASQFMMESFERSVLGTIALYDIDPARLKLELTESVIITDIGHVVARMTTLRGAGIEFALDDFGTGYSSLSYIRQLPIRQIKIDRSFVQDADASPAGASLAKTIVQMGLDLDLVVLAEGIETETQHRLFATHGCHAFQGFCFGRPMPRTHFETRVQELVIRPTLEPLHETLSASAP